MFRAGNYVSWSEDYADGFAGRDWGDGIIVETKENERRAIYKVFRNKHKDFYWFIEEQLKLKGETK